MEGGRPNNLTQPTFLKRHTSGSSIPSWRKLFFGENSQNAESRVRPREAPIVLEDHLPQPVEDRKIADEVKSLKDFVSAHVDTYYRAPEGTDRWRGNTRISEQDSDDDFSDEQTFNTRTPAATSAAPPIPPRRSEHTRTASSNDHRGDPSPDWVQRGSPSQGELTFLSWRASIHHTIAKAIVDCIDPYGDEEYPFLPREIVLFLRAIPRNNNSDVFELAVSEWRIRSSYLLNLHRSEKHQDKWYIETREKNIQRAVGSLNRFLANYIDPVSNKEREEQLLGLMRHAADLGVLLLQQPARYEFSWTQTEEARESRHSSQPVTDRPRKSRGSTRLAKFPALLKVTDNNGKRFSRPQRISSAEWDHKQRISRTHTLEHPITSDTQYYKRTAVG